MNLKHVVIDGFPWDAIDEHTIPVFDTRGWLGGIFTFNIQPGDQDIDWMQKTELVNENSGITLNLGWGTTPRYPCDATKACTTICDLLPLFFTRTGFDITIGPYIDPKAEGPFRHKWCLPKKIPVIANRYIMRHYYHKIRFQSSCDCGNGDITGCK